MRTLLAILALATLLAPLAGAHVSDMPQSATLEAGPYLVFFEARPTPLYTNLSATMVAQVSDAATGRLLRDVPATILVGGPGATERKQMQNDGSGYLVASMLFTAPGAHSARLLLRNATTNESYSVDTEFEVFPNLPFRIRPVDEAQDVYVNEITPLAFEVLDPVTLARKDAFDALTVRVERWSEDHKTFLGEEVVTASSTSTGIWRIDHTFPERGMYHLRFASEDGGFNYAEVPLLHVYAVSRPAQEDASTPSVGAGLLVAGAAALALLLRRR